MSSIHLPAFVRQWRQLHARNAQQRSYLHDFSETALHSLLMVAVVGVATIAMIEAVDMGVKVWQLDRVVVERVIVSVPRSPGP
ncbi:MAG TPA: hypothetical protein VGE47_01420 [Burkholderiaceae bacterium]